MKMLTTRLHIRPATSGDVPIILRFIRELAIYERQPNAVLATEAGLLRDGFGSTPRFHALIADWTEHGNRRPVGFALYFNSYSTWEGHHGIYLEDIFVSPEHRGVGLGKALLSRVAAIAVEQGCPRLEWSVLDWNQPSIDFYHRTGAKRKSEWFMMCLAGEQLQALATHSL